MRQESHGVERYDCSSGAGWPQTADSVTGLAWSTTALRDPNGEHPVICMVTPANRYRRAWRTAQQIADTFVHAYEMYQGIPSHDRLGHALLTADNILGDRDDDADNSMSVSAVTLHSGGIDYLGIGEGTIAVLGENSAATLRGPAFEHYTAATPCHGLRGNGVDPTLTDVGRYQDQSEPEELIVLGTKLLCAVDDDELRQILRRGTSVAEATRSIVDEVAEATGDRRPGVRVVGAAGRRRESRQTRR